MGKNDDMVVFFVVIGIIIILIANQELLEGRETIDLIGFAFLLTVIIWAFFHAIEVRT